jgi:hypothetical protein
MYNTSMLLAGDLNQDRFVGRSYEEPQDLAEEHDLCRSETSKSSFCRHAIDYVIFPITTE